MTFHHFYVKYILGIKSRRWMSFFCQQLLRGLSYSEKIVMLSPATNTPGTLGVLVHAIRTEVSMGGEVRERH